jgi:hypothetical protein
MTNRDTTPTTQDAAFLASISMDPAATPKYPPKIRVLSKSPHPAGFCYPLGATAMSDVLRGLPMFDQFTLRFSNGSPIFKMTPPLEGYPLLRITYTSYPVYVP